MSHGFGGRAALAVLFADSTRPAAKTAVRKKAEMIFFIEVLLIVNKTDLIVTSQYN